ncbi:MAG TPA: hypothetical protein VFG37_03725 [Planctomycetota bacterium]|nr:hypothetical protein [Planctomycetota bacterium]
MRPLARWRRLIERIARLFRRAVPPVPSCEAMSGARDPRRSARRPAGTFGDGLEERAGAGGDPLDGASPLGDFTDRDEVQRFAGLPPIGAEALEGVDWDELARELTGPR